MWPCLEYCTHDYVAMPVRTSKHKCAHMRTHLYYPSLLHISITHLYYPSLLPISITHLYYPSLLPHLYYPSLLPISVTHLYARAHLGWVDVTANVVCVCDGNTAWVMSVQGV